MSQVILLPEIVNQELRHLVGGEGGDVDDEVVVAGVVAGDVGEGLGVVLAGFVEFLDLFARLFFVEVPLFHHALHPMFLIRDEEYFDGVGSVFEDVEAGASHNDAGFLFGEFTQEFGLGVVELLGVHLEGLVGDGGGGAELFVETAEFRPPARFCGFDLFRFFRCEFEFFQDTGEDGFVIKFYVEQFADFLGDFVTASSRFAVDSDDDVLLFHYFWGVGG